MPQSRQTLTSDTRSPRVTSDSIIDLCKVVAFLVLAIAARSVLTNQHTNHVEGVSEPRPHVTISSAIKTPDLVDLSTVGF